MNDKDIRDSMADLPKKKKIGRPVREFDAKLFENLCHVHCTIAELEAILCTEVRILSNWCQRYYGTPFNITYKRFAEGGKASLRRNQAHLSKTNAAMAIWLGKQWLGQKEFPIDREEFHGKLSELLDLLKKEKKPRDDRLDASP